MATNPRFVASFDVESSDNYTSFIAGIRRRLSNTKHYSHNRPVLPPADPPGTPPTRWFHVVLRTRTSTLTLATRADNLYLEGFRSSNGTWWELTSGMIPGATDVGFGGSTYRDLLGDTDKLAGVALGPKQMTDAVNALASRTTADARSGTKQQEAKHAVVALLLMVNEAARFLTVSGFVADRMDPRAKKKSETITGEMKAQVNGWQDLSAALLETDKYEEEKSKHGKKKLEKKGPETFPAFDKMGVKTADQAAATLGILLFVAVEGGGMTRDKALQLFRGSPNY